jgi:hypothetical protein
LLAALHAPEELALDLKVVAAAAAELRTVQLETSPVGMLEAVVRASRMVASGLARQAKSRPKSCEVKSCQAESGRADGSRPIDGVALAGRALAPEPSAPAIGADEFLPTFTYVVLEARLPRLRSILEYIRCFRDPDAMMGSEGYCFASVCTAVEIIMDLPVERLSAPPASAEAPSSPSPSLHRTIPQKFREDDREVGALGVRE